MRINITCICKIHVRVAGNSIELCELAKIRSTAALRKFHGNSYYDISVILTPFSASNCDRCPGGGSIDNTSDSATTAAMSDSSESNDFRDSVLWSCSRCQYGAYANTTAPKSEFCCDDHKTIICETCAKGWEKNSLKDWCYLCVRSARVGKYRPVGRYVGPSPIESYPAILPIIRYGSPLTEEPSLVTEMLADESAIVSFSL
jgi:hypothetical protein